MHDNANKDFDLISEMVLTFSGNTKLILVEKNDVVIIDLLKELVVS